MALRKVITIVPEPHFKNNMQGVNIHYFKVYIRNAFSLLVKIM